MATIDLQRAVNAALNEAVVAAKARIHDVLYAGAAEDEKVLAANAAEIARLKARIVELEGDAGPVEPPPVEPPPVEPPPSGTFNPRTMSVAQIAAATGLKDASVLKKSAGVTIKAPGTFENMDYTGQVTIETTGKVLFRNCLFDGGGGYYGVLNIPERFRAEEIRLEFCELKNAQNCVAGANLYVFRCDISEWENGVNFWGPGQLVESYIHDQKERASGAHFDGVEINGGGNIKILRNYIVNGASQTAAVMLAAYNGKLHDIEVDGNYLAGGGYPVYVDAGDRISVTNNTIKKGFWGHYALYNGTPVKIDASTGNLLI